MRKLQENNILLTDGMKKPSAKQFESQKAYIQDYSNLNNLPA